MFVAGRDMVISPDGTHVAYVGNNGRQLFVRALDQLDSVPLAGVDFPSGVFIKPDGQWVGFVGEFVLKKAAINGGAVQSLLKFGGRGMLGATWGEDGPIIFATEETATGLERLSEDGGATTVLTRPNRERGEVDHVWPAFLPSGQAVLFTIINAGGIDNAEIAVLDLRTRAQKVILRGGSAPRYLPSGHLVYGAAGSLRAVAFDLERLEVLGTPVPVVPQLLTTPAGAADFDVASDGTLVYVRGGLQEPARTLMWVDREGREEPIQVPVRAYQYLRISPDGTRVALDVRDQERDIWLWEFARRTLTRFTFDPTPDRFPVWTANGPASALHVGPRRLQEYIFAGQRRDGSPRTVDPEYDDCRPGSNGCVAGWRMGDLAGRRTARLRCQPPGTRARPSHRTARAHAFQRTERRGLARRSVASVSVQRLWALRDLGPPVCRRERRALAGLRWWGLSTALESRRPGDILPRSNRRGDAGRDWTGVWLGCRNANEAVRRRTVLLRLRRSVRSHV